MATWREPYLTHGGGREWHVYDCVRSNGRYSAQKPGSPKAAVRPFVQRTARS